MAEHPHSDPGGERVPPKQDEAVWRAHWRERGQEPREHELRECLRITPHIQRQQFPFASMRLHRADIEWLLAELPAGEPLDLRGASLRNEDLSGLDLRGLRGGLSAREEVTATDEELAAAALNLEDAKLYGTQLQGAALCGARLSRAVLARARLAGAALIAAQLEGADLRGAHFEGARLRGADLTATDLREARLDGADLRDANLTDADLSEGHLHGAILRDALLEGTNLSFASLGSRWVSKEELNAVSPDLPTYLGPADLRRAVMSPRTRLNSAALAEERTGVALADVRWGEVNLAVVNWKAVERLEDEREARQPRTTDDTFTNLPKRQSRRLAEYQAAVRAYRQLATVLQAQGLSEEAARFAYRGQHLERVVLRRQLFLRRRKRRGSAGQRRQAPSRLQAARAYGLSVFLDWLAGYGYHPWRTAWWYIVCVGLFAVVDFLAQSATTPKLTPVAALVFSLTSFHGRGFFPGGLSLNDPLTRLAACEAVVGLLIEISFIATFTQRFFGKGAGA